MSPARLRDVRCYSKGEIFRLKHWKPLSLRLTPSGANGWRQQRTTSGKGFRDDGKGRKSDCGATERRLDSLSGGFSPLETACGIKRSRGPVRGQFRSLAVIDQSNPGPQGAKAQPVPQVAFAETQSLDYLRT